VKQSQIIRNRTTDSSRNNIGKNKNGQKPGIPGLANLNNRYNAGHSFGSIQTRLNVRVPGDRYEREAEKMARLVTGPDPLIVSNKLNGNNSGVSMKGSGASVQVPLIERQLNKSGSSGSKMPGETRDFMESRFGENFRDVRIHTDKESGILNNILNSKAFTTGRDIFFNQGQYNPGGQAGKELLAHELTHVVQQKGSEQIQGSFFGDLWEGIKSVGRAIGSAISSAVEWIGEKLHDAAIWVVNLLRDLPQRLIRFGETIIDGLKGIASFIPEAVKALKEGGIKGFGDWLWEKAKSGGYWVLRLVSRIFDLVGGPEIIEFVDHVLSKASPLTSTEIKEAKSVLGPNAIRWNDVRVAEGGLLDAIFWINDDRAFTSFHTINLPDRTDLPIVIHELVHVYQYEKAGSLYLGQAIHAQATIGYDYGGDPGLIEDRKKGKHYKDYNREQQAQIAEDYFKRKQEGGDTSAFDPFIAELQAGQL